MTGVRKRRSRWRSQRHYFVPMAKEGGKWKVGTIGPSAFPG
jgi:hypothetical protein